MTVAQSRGANAAGQLLLKAVAISVAIHLGAFGAWKWGQTHILWKGLPVPAWLQLTPPKLHATPARPLRAVQPPRPPPLLYVDVDPALAAAQPPANPKFYSTADTVAANPEKKVPSDEPQITGTQDKVMKTVAPGARSVPLQPSPPAEAKAETAEKESAESKALSKPSYTAGGLADAKPAQKMEERKGISESDNGTEAATEPKHERPRTLAQARERQGAPGERMRQEGGANRVAMDPAVDAVRTVYGDYDRDFIDAVQQRWFELLRERQDTVAGRVVLEFNLHANGRISDMKMQFSDVNELLTLICQQAVQDPAPYKEWPREMRREITDPRQIRFTFYYSN
ncbi:MAG: hypothetical protein ABSG78_01665 [Verrucomicrobiota bacterium]|jgi:outer membrane biosynthesis protein TonB